eukprot:363939-Chlamydomonas_euryale.AAC.5
MDYIRHVQFVRMHMQAGTQQHTVSVLCPTAAQSVCPLTQQHRVSVLSHSSTECLSSVPQQHRVSVPQQHTVWSVAYARYLLVDVLTASTAGARKREVDVPCRQAYAHMLAH